MGRLHYCENGVSVTDQVLRYLATKSAEDYQPVKLYYDNYKEYWYNRLADYLDKATFIAEFDYKLCRAIDSFKIETADSIAANRGYTRLGAFNGWFYKILANWQSNVKTTSFRLKKRPSTQCPVCGRFVGRIDSEHLKHLRTINDLPRYFVWKGQIYESSVVPRVNAVTWGDKTASKWNALNRGDVKKFSTCKKRVKWPWFMPDGKKAVVCPFTRKVIKSITDEYLQSLPEKYCRYAENVSWEVFCETYPTSLIQSEVYSLDRGSFDSDGKLSLRDYVSRDCRNLVETPTLDYAVISGGSVPLAFEHVFRMIDDCVMDGVNRDILKLVAAGYSLDDVCDTLSIDKKEIRRRIREVRDNNVELAASLVD